ncbi:hypothetical protein K505DRAFT_263715 [Melanomma pulvis-pyrius CBS 109.77]|uniref:NACHT domain-containing protein n=1 Tax=Melanomma pulvis-pyrius CBS 109.77 TaxID=1314802 RepID=A0A6A6XY60_9PLEO|nr:hypothetical protein K505DRAFT_263715 [Melanomma pulvis-pyrius CBS 109.77]
MPVTETLGVVGSIIAIVQISKTIISACQFYIDAVDGASSDLRVILIEISALKGIAKSLQYLTQPNVANSALLNQLSAVTGPIEGCNKALKDLETLFPSAAVSIYGKRSKQRKLDAAVAALAWPLKSGKAKRLLQEIIQHKTTINLALTAEFVQDLKDVKQKVEQIRDLLTETECEKVYKWLETTNPSNIHNRSQALFEPGTASWMLRTPQWPLWIEGKHRCLWIHGIPGAGKSILASYLAEEIEKHCISSSSETSKLGHAYYYCYFGHNQDESSHFLRWIIGQLCRQSTKVPEELHNIYKSGKTPNLSSLLSVLHSIMEGFQRVYLVLDAVDESMPREDLLHIIRDLSTDARFSSLGLIVTSRQYIDIEQVLELYSIPITMSNPFVEEDIGTLVHSTIQSDARYQRWPEDLRREIQDTIPKGAKGMFRWAICQLDILKRLRPDVSVIRAALSNLPKSLDETYERIFLAIPEDDWLSVQHVFHWLVYHNDLFRTKISLNTLLYAVQHSTADCLSPNSDQLHDFEGLRERCGCLIMIEPEEMYTGHKKIMVVSFAHYTVKEYLTSPRISQKKVRFFAIVQEKIQKQFAGIALRQALAIQPDRLTGYDNEYDFECFYDLMDSDFKLYCGISSVLQLKAWSEAISSDSTLMELSETLVDPYRQAHRDFVILLHGIYCTPYCTPDFDDDFYFWDIIWGQISSRNTAVFLIFLITSGVSDTLYLARAFARKHSMLTTLTQQMHITIQVERLFEDYETDRDFVGSIPELVTQWAFAEPDTFTFILDLIIEHGVTHFDLSTLLLLYIGNHLHEHCQKSCDLERLLDFGASANGPEGAFVTPLQIAVVCWDLRGIELLLNAGAKVNALGGNDSRWPPRSIMEQFNHLHGASSLCIIKHFECIYEGESMNNINFDGNEIEKIRARLCESGAVEIAPDGSEPGSHNVSDESNGGEYHK